MNLNIGKRLIMDHLIVKVTGVWILITMFCALSVEAYGESCTTTANCTDPQNICSSYNCICSNTTFRNNTDECATRIAFNETCDDTDSAADQCAQANMGCLNDGPGIYKCLCNSDYYESNGTCYDRMKPYEACDDGQCVVHATCNVGNCTCDMGYEASPIVSPTQCNGAGGETVPILYILAMVKVLSQMLISF
ncbi:Hypothetical predicted protein [Mytilus galloprovincialis]|uniref:EB domain-containing protein n=2 Tax=Mytilus galloprovincialis TaxID=29158 RepID=A0A8B6GE35_MYTGA|nr:Hypothetical predicted protein [Mytilus galloprovincialis]